MMLHTCPITICSTICIAKSEGNFRKRMPFSLSHYGLATNLKRHSRHNESICKRFLKSSFTNTPIIYMLDDKGDL